MTPDERARLRALVGKAPWALQTGQKWLAGVLWDAVFTVSDAGRAASLIAYVDGEAWAALFAAAPSALPRLLDALDAAEAEVARLRAALERYGIHTPDCAWWGREPTIDGWEAGGCNCGLDTLLREETPAHPDTGQAGDTSSGGRGTTEGVQARRRTDGGA